LGVGFDAAARHLTTSDAPAKENDMTTATPYITVRESRAALDWYVKHMGAEMTVEPIVMEDGSVGHVEFAIDGARIMMSDEAPDYGVVAPDPARAATVTIHLDVSNCDEVVQAARSGGARVDREPGDTPYGRIGTIVDPFGHRWMINGSSSIG
jgi:PhnB protein